MTSSRNADRIDRHRKREPATPKPPQNTPWPKSSPEEALGGSGGALGELWEALGEPAGGSGGALGEPWEALYIEKLPINRPSGRYVTMTDSSKNLRTQGPWAHE